MEKFLETNAGWLLTLITAAVGFIVSWTRTTDRVQHLNERLDKQDKTMDERFDEQKKTLEDIKTMGSPSSRLAITILDGKVQNQAQRVIDIEKVVSVVAKMATDVEWIKEVIKKGNHFK